MISCFNKIRRDLKRVSSLFETTCFWHFVPKCVQFWGIGQKEKIHKCCNQLLMDFCLYPEPGSNRHSLAAIGV